MIDQRTFQRVAAALPVLQRADANQAHDFQRVVSLARIPPGKDVFVQGDRIEAIPLLVSGVVRVYQIGETGREVTLYRFRPGESCVLTANAILTRQTFPAIATVEQEAEAILVPAETFRQWVQRYDLWRDFFFDLVSQRLASVMGLVDEVAFRRLDVRVAGLLQERARAEHPIRITHQEIAAELGSSREVISRILEDLSDRGIVRPERGSISIEDPAGLRRLAAM
ncbi:MAG TPA: Crp/Fnr family transcriptional regulator [Anaerolineales bacterium]|nr:Crp/Fnr family transcriptional regulator [Anaerolineales bacterium]